MRVIHLLRKPLSENTVASNVLKHGVGGLNIDGCRIGTGGEALSCSKADPYHAADGTQRTWNPTSTRGIDRTQHQAGRWPANLILQHLDGCRCGGEKKVKACGVGAFKRSTAKDRNGQTGAAYGAESRPEGTEYVNYADAEGKETIANWICAEGCPVKALDEQSGTLSSPPSYIRGVASGNVSVYSPGIGDKEAAVSVNYGDKGGASRFFKQVGGQK